jgi:uncharacterized protein (TIGR00106 family)
MAIAEIIITPLGTGTPSLSKYVASAVKVLEQEKDLKYELTPMGTVVEGDLGKILLVAEKMHEACFDEGVSRVATTVKIDDRRDKTSTMKDKVNSVMRKLGHQGS